ncbi:MAG: hypothetical protein LBM73_03750 [Candidatus Nomurabacteria bacterium]|jgi:hypothetical protein|nr:hypothetical protein [Candidatus Nomurabacteria bacterium]
MNLVRNFKLPPFINFPGGVDPSAFIDAYAQLAPNTQRGGAFYRNPKDLVAGGLQDLIDYLDSTADDSSIGVVTPIVSATCQQAIDAVNYVDGLNVDATSQFLGKNRQILPSMGNRRDSAQTLAQASFGLLVPSHFDGTRRTFSAPDLIHGLMKPWDGFVHQDSAETISVPMPNGMDDEFPISEKLVPIKKGFNPGDPTQIKEIRQLPQYESAGSLSQAIVEAALWSMLCDNPADDPYRAYFIRVPSDSENGREKIDSNFGGYGMGEWAMDIATSRKTSGRIYISGTAGCKQFFIGWLRHWRPNSGHNAALPSLFEFGDMRSDLGSALAAEEK